MDAGQSQFQHDAFVDQLTLNRSRLYAFIRSLVHDADDAEDIFQKTSVTVWQKSMAGDPPQNFVAFFCQVARGHVLDHLKKTRREKARFGEMLIDLLVEQQSKLQPPEESRRIEALRFCVDDLSDKQRDLLQQHYERREPIAKIAERLGRTVHSVHSSLRHTRAKLLSCIQWRLGKGGDS